MLLILATTSAYAKKTQSATVSFYSATLLAQINLYRQENGLNMLRFEPRLVKLAQHHSREMSQQGKVSHHNFKERMEASESRLCVENVGWNNNDPQKRFEEWQRSLDNNQNLLAEGIVKVGIAEVGNYVTFIACR